MNTATVKCIIILKDPEERTAGWQGASVRLQ